MKDLLKIHGLWYKRSILVLPPGSHVPVPNFNLVSLLASLLLKRLRDRAACLSSCWPSGERQRVAKARPAGAPTDKLQLVFFPPGSPKIILLGTRSRKERRFIC